jgi:hypothetical protein
MLSRPVLQARIDANSGVKFKASKEKYLIGALRESLRFNTGSRDYPHRAMSGALNYQNQLMVLDLRL